VAEGAGCFGVGLLVDLGGDDVYRLTEAGQGFGGPEAWGGCSTARAATSTPRTPTRAMPRLAPPRAAPPGCAQGSAFGLSAGAAGPAWPGGFGLLADGAGDDRYRLGEAGQGEGECGGLGALVDLSGDDDYRLAARGRGPAGTERGLLLDGAGRDRYECQTSGLGRPNASASALRRRAGR